MNKKIFEIDIDSLEDCQKALNQIKSAIGQIKLKENGFISKNERNKIVFDHCFAIMSTDISDLYKDMSLDITTKYCVYAHTDKSKRIAVEKDGRTTFAASLGMSYIPFYIGKGTIDRPFDLNRSETHRKVRQRLKQFDQDIEVKVLFENKSELDALCIESKLIDIFQLITNGGFLCNLDEGVQSVERRLRYKDKLKDINIFYKNLYK